MARKARQRISYVLPLANSAGGHRLGVNGLAVDEANSRLYSGGRDGVICAWDLNLDLKNSTALDYDAKLPPPIATSFRQQVQAHTHWINDIALAQSNEALVSASSDITVKVWRPHASDGLPPQTIGLHTDYVKTLAVPYSTCDWVASGGLDRHISVWDLNGAGQKLKINVAEDEVSSLLSKEKGSVYALAATNSLLASGGPESTVRVWDCRTGKRVTKLVGHTDNIRDILVSQDGTTIMTASSDHTVKVWSTIAGRCMFTLTMHDASVWSLFSSDPDLSIFYSSDKNGLVAKTDTRNTIELDEGLSTALFQEHEGVHKVVAAGDYLWTATSRPSINRYRDINTDDAEIEVPENYDTHTRGSAAKSRYPSPPDQREPTLSFHKPSLAKRKIPLKHMLRLSNTAYFPVPVTPPPDENTSPSQRRATLEAPPTDLIITQPVRAQPEYAIEGQNGIIKHVMLNDRKRVLTLDTAGEVVMWDLLKCVPIRSFGKRHLEDVKDEVTTNATVANWCTVDTRTGSVAVVLEEHTCFDAEMYADELELDEGVEYREDQRINLGKWVLRYLFDGLISEEMRRDEAVRAQLLSAREQQRLQRDNAPSSIQLPQAPINGWNSETNGPLSATTLRPGTNGARAVTTPGLNIGLATPGAVNSPVHSKHTAGHLPATSEEGAPLERRTSSQSHRTSSDRHGDYFSSSRAPNADLATPGGNSQPATTPGDNHEPATPSGEGPPKDGSTPSKGLFGKKFGMSMSFSGMKKIGRMQTKDEPAVVEEKEEVESDTRSSKTSNSRVVDDNLLGAVQRIRFAYEDSLQQQAQQQQAAENGLPVPKTEIELLSAITPSLPSETPILRPPLNTTILIQEERPEAGGVADLFEGTVGSLADSTDLIEKTAPMWLGDVLLRNQIPVKDVVKISFILEPWKNALPSIASDGNNRLNANRMLRAKKILAYVAERIEPMQQVEQEEQAGTKLRPEEYLELWCQNQLIAPTMTLATIRSHIWRGGGDVILYYKSNGRKEIVHAPSGTTAPPAPGSDAGVTSKAPSEAGSEAKSNAT